MLRKLFIGLGVLCLPAGALASPADSGWLDQPVETKKDVERLMGKLVKVLASSGHEKLEAQSAYVFDPETLQEIAKKGVGLPYEQMFDVIQRELVKRYPDRVVDTRRWIFNVAGGAMGQLTVLYCSTREYLIFFGTPIGTEGFSGRFKHADVWDFTVDGEMQTYSEGEFERHVFKPGSAALLARGTGKGYRIPDHAWMLEYMRGNVLGAMKFGIYSSTANVTLDWHSAWNQIHDCGKIALRQIFGRHPKKID